MSAWISVRNWRSHQHYDPAKRVPPWIKNNTELMANDAYLGLSEHRALLLHRLWLEYASSRCRLSLDTRSLSRRLNMRVTKTDLDSLLEAGFIEFVASRSLAEGYHSASDSRARVEAEAEKEVDTPPTPPQKGGGNGVEKTPRYTGCRFVRAGASGTYVQDPLGVDKPPAYWPHPKPTRAEVRTALAEHGDA